MKTNAMRVLSFLFGLLGLSACGSARPDPQTSLARLIHACRAEVTDAATRTEANDALRDGVDSGSLDGKFRDELDEILGRGDACSTHPECLERGFEPDDRVYVIGTDPASGVARLPMLFVHFDRSGRVAGMRYLTVD